jgi:hypothetical protein
MILYAVQWHSAPLPPHEDEGDLEWTTWAGHDDYLDEDEANEAAREFDAAVDGAYLHRVLARRVDGPSVARTTGHAVVATRPSSAEEPAATRWVSGADSRGGAPRRP